jgi:hypothetical protein
MNSIGRMKNVFSIMILVFILLSCTSKNNSDNANVSDADSIAIMDSMRPDMPPPPPDSGSFDGHRPPPPPDGMRPDGPPPPPPHGKGRPPHKPDNMRGFDPASEDDMEDNGMSRYMENNDEEGWD